MNHSFKIIIILAFAITFFSCNNEFIYERLDISGVATSAIIISPQWDANNYEFKCEGMVNADFTVTSKPEWLVLDSNDGKFQDSIATIHCSANQEPQFSNIGFYIDQMVVTTGGRQYAVPVYYITEGNPTVQVNRTFDIASTSYNNQLRISNSGDGILIWDIVSLPEWLEINKSQFNPTSLILKNGAAASLSFTFNFKAAMQNNLKGTIILKTNDKNNPLVEIAVTANLGIPHVSLNNILINFGSSETTKTTRISNNGSGILVWNFEGLPEWLSVSTATGTVNPYHSSDVTFTCNRLNIPPGLNSATLHLKTNDANEASVAVTVTIRMPGTGANIKAIEGNVVDATFDKSTNILYYVTSQPNKLVAYDVTAKTLLHEVALTKAPTCLATGENFNQAMVGHNGMISAVDLSSFQVSKTYELKDAVYDMEWASEDWFCYTILSNYSYNLLWINSSTGETFQTLPLPNCFSLGAAVLKKIPNQPYIYAYHKNLSPSGIFVYDLSRNEMKSYTNTSIGNVWFFKQGELMVTEYSSIIRTSEITVASGSQNSDPSSIGKLKLDPYANKSWWIDYSEGNHSIWAMFSYHTNAYYPPVKGRIYQFADNDYTLMNTYLYDDMYQPDIKAAAFEVEPRYFFVNSAGTELSLLRKTVNDNTWSVEFIAIP